MKMTHQGHTLEIIAKREGFTFGIPGAKKEGELTGAYIINIDGKFAREMSKAEVLASIERCKAGGYVIDGELEG